MSDETCPWCGETLDDIWEVFTIRYPDAVETECESCGQPINVERDIIYLISKVKVTHA